MFEITAVNIVRSDYLIRNRQGKIQKHLSDDGHLCVQSGGLLGWYQHDTERLVIITVCYPFIPFYTADTLWCWSFLLQKLDQQSFWEIHFSHTLKSEFKCQLATFTKL